MSTPQPDSPATAQPSFTPGDWRADADDKLNPDRAFGIVRDLDPSHNGGEPHTEIIAEVCDGPTAKADAHLLAASTRLYAYAKAEALRNEWLDVRHSGGTTDEAVDALGKFEHQLTLMGWQRGNSSAPFLANYRYAALALAEGGGK